MVVVDPVVGDGHVLVDPELRAAGAATTRELALPVRGVVADDLVVVHDEALDLALRLAAGVEGVLAVVLDAVEPVDAVGAAHQRGARVLGDGAVLDGPVRAGVVVDDAFVARRHEAADREVPDPHPRCALRERVPIHALAVEHCPRRAHEARVRTGRDLVELVPAQGVDPRCEPERRPRRCLRVEHVRVVTGGDDHRTLRSSGRSTAEDLAVAADPGGRLGGPSARRRDRRRDREQREREHDAECRAPSPVRSHASEDMRRRARRDASHRSVWLIFLIGVHARDSASRGVSGDGAFLQSQRGGGTLGSTRCAVTPPDTLRSRDPRPTRRRGADLPRSHFRRR